MTIVASNRNGETWQGLIVRPDKMRVAQTKNMQTGKFCLMVIFDFEGQEVGFVLTEQEAESLKEMIGLTLPYVQEGVEVAVQ